MPVSDYDSSSFVGRDDLVEEVIRRAFGVPPQSRSVLIEGPANRGKSWLLCRTHEKLNDPLLYSPIISSCPPIATFLFTAEDGLPFDPLWLVACIWWALHPHLPSLFWPTNLTGGADKTSAIRLLHDFFTRDGSDGQTLIFQIKGALDAAASPVLLALLVDGLDEFEQLDPFERQFVEPLFRSPQVRVIATRRSQVLTAHWGTFSLRPQKKDEPISLARLSAKDAEDQINKQFRRKGSPLSFADLTPLFNHYAWQNPGANARFVDCAITNHASGARRLIMRDDIRTCLLELSKSGRFAEAILESDLDWLGAVVRQFPSIGSSEVPTYALNVALAAAAGRPVGDLERNAWIGRLQDRAIVVRRTNGQCLVHEEFAALCQEWEEKGTP